MLEPRLHQSEQRGRDQIELREVFENQQRSDDAVGLAKHAHVGCSPVPTLPAARVDVANPLGPNAQFRRMVQAAYVTRTTAFTACKPATKVSLATPATTSANWMTKSPTSTAVRPVV